VDIQDVASESWDAASGTGNTYSKIADVGLSSAGNLEMGRWQTNQATKRGA
jgi:hypothetical protein